MNAKIAKINSTRKFVGLQYYIQVQRWGCMYINDAECNPLNTVVKENRCYEDIEILSLQCHHFYLPSERLHV